MGDVGQKLTHLQIGSINEAFTSEYMPTSPLMASIICHQQQQQNKSPHHSSPILSPPTSATPSISIKRRPPAPLSSTETRFAFPPPPNSSIALSSPLMPTKKPPQPPIFYLGNNNGDGFNQQTTIPSLFSSTLSSFPLAKPPIGQRRKQPAPDPITTTSSLTLLNKPYMYEFILLLSAWLKI